MAIQLLQGFEITSSSPIDSRFVLSKAQMAAINDNVMPSKYFAICTDDGKIYSYDKLKVSNSDTGKFEPIASSEEVIIRGYYLNEKFYTDSTYTVECTKSIKYLYIDVNTNGSLYTWNGTKYVRSVKDASSTIAGIMRLYSAHGQNEDGTMSQKAITNGVQSIKFNVDKDDEECLILDLPWDNIQGRY